MSCDQLPPHAPDAERGVLGCILLDPTTALPVAQGAIGLNAFYDLRHRRIYQGIIDVAATGRSLDMVVIPEGSAGHLEAVGGLEYLNKIIDGTPSASHLPEYIRLVREQERRRRILRVCGEFSLKVRDTRDADALVDEFEREALAVRGDRMENREADAGMMVNRLFDRLDAGLSPVAIKTGLHTVDKILKMRAGQLVVLAARPSMGKTACACRVIENVAIVDRVPAGIISLEMGMDEICQRFAASMSGVPYDDFENPEQGQQGAILEALETIKRAPLWVCDQGGMSISQLMGLARRWRQRHAIQLLVIDYLGLLRTDTRNRSRYEAITEISASLKQLARDLGIVVLCLCQLNRQAADDGEQPRMHHLRDSGAIEQDADAVVLLHTTSIEGTTRRVSALIEKQRNGPLGEAKLTFNGPTMRFEAECPIEMSDIPRLG
jgi:replicative DNA helicase